MLLDALNPPNMYIEVAIEPASAANARSEAYPRMYLARDFRTSYEVNTDDGAYRIELTCHGGKISY